MTFCQRNSDCDESPGKQTADISSQVHKSNYDKNCEFLAILDPNPTNLKKRLSTVVEGNEVNGTVISPRQSRDTLLEGTNTPISY
jgi:hypothetical protein